MHVGIATLPSKLDVKKIAAEAQKLDYTIDDGNVHMANGQGRGIPKGFQQLPTIWAAIQEIASLRKLTPVNIMINRLEPGAPVPLHRDFIPPTPLQPRTPCIERWHLAVETNDDCFWWDEKSDEDIHFPKGMWNGPVPYWLKHTVKNDGKTARLHLIVDLDTPEPVGAYAD